MRVAATAALVPCAGAVGNKTAAVTRYTSDLFVSQRRCWVSTCKAQGTTATTSATSSATSVDEGSTCQAQLNRL